MKYFPDKDMPGIPVNTLGYTAKEELRLQGEL